MIDANAAGAEVQASALEEAMTDTTAPAPTGLLSIAMHEARELSHDHVGTEHLLLGLLLEEGGAARAILNEQGITAEQLRAELKRAIGASTEKASNSPLPITPRVKQALESGAEAARRTHHGDVRSEHVLLGLLDQADGLARRALERFSVDIDECRRRTQERLRSDAQNDDKPEPREAEIPALEAFGEEVAVRESESLGLAPIPPFDHAVLVGLLRRENRAILLCGASGCGKTSAAKRLGAALRSRRGAFELPLRRLVAIPLPCIVAGARHRGRVEERLRIVFKEAAESGDVALFFDDFECVLGCNELALALELAMAAFTIPIVAAIDTVALETLARNHPSLYSRFVRMAVPPLLETALDAALREQARRLEQFHSMRITDAALVAAADAGSADSRGHGASRLSNAITLLDRAAAAVRAAMLRPSPAIKTVLADAIRFEREADQAAAEGDERRCASLAAKAGASRATAHALILALSSTASSVELTAEHVQVARRRATARPPSPKMHT